MGDRVDDLRSARPIRCGGGAALTMSKSSMLIGKSGWTENATAAATTLWAATSEIFPRKPEHAESSRVKSASKCTSIKTINWVSPVPPTTWQRVAGISAKALAFFPGQFNFHSTKLHSTKNFKETSTPTLTHTRTHTNKNSEFAGHLVLGSEFFRAKCERQVFANTAYNYSQLVWQHYTSLI